MTDSAQKTAVVIGASSGVGRAIARAEFLRRIGLEDTLRPHTERASDVQIRLRGHPQQ